VVKLGTQVVDEARRRVQQETLDRRGHRDDPLYRIRGLLRRGREHLTDRQVHRLNTGLAVGDPFFEVTVAWHCYQQLRSMYQATSPADGRSIAEQVIASFPTCPIPEVARLGRTLRQWRQHVLARFDTHQISNGGTEAVNLLIEKTRRLARLQNLRPLPAPHPPRRLRPAPVPTPHPCLIPKSPQTTMAYGRVHGELLVDDRSRLSERPHGSSQVGPRSSL
jgi:hypothetical protein